VKTSNLASGFSWSFSAPLSKFWECLKTESDRLQNQSNNSSLVVFGPKFCMSFPFLPSVLHITLLSPSLIRSQ
jgi:hypothetical protein